MKKIKYLILMIIMLFSLSSCVFKEDETPITNPEINTNDDTDNFFIPESDNPYGYKITYVGNNDNIYYSTFTQTNKAINPGSPNKKCSKFLGWFTDKDCTNLYNFNLLVKSELILYAGWDMDIMSLANLIYRDTIKANVKIVANDYKSSTSSQGSGVIFFEDDYSYYALTNIHVVYFESKYVHYRAYDCYNNEYECKLINNNVSFDLAIIRILKNNNIEKELKTLNFVTLI